MTAHHPLLGERVLVRSNGRREWVPATIRAAAHMHGEVHYRVDDGAPGDDSRSNGWTWAEWVTAAQVRRVA